MDRIKLKTLAKEQIKGNILFLFLCMFLIVVVVFGVSVLVPIFGAIAVNVITPALSIGLLSVYFGLSRGVKPGVEGLFSAMPIFLKALFLQIVTAIFVVLWTMLLIVPGIIKGISYMFAPYLLAENHDIGVMEAIDQSKKLTNGHKMELFVLTLSFFPWMLLISVTFGIAAVYVIPYMQMTLVNAFNELKGEPQVIPAAKTEEEADYDWSREN